MEWSDGEWGRWPAGPLLIFERTVEGGGGRLLGGTGLTFTALGEASTGYVLARDVWGQGFATEALRAMVLLARRTWVIRLEAICHTGHVASAHVLEKCGFERMGTLREHTEFPNAQPGQRLDVLLYRRVP